MADEKADQPVADYYPPGATEPQVRPDNVPPAEESAEVKDELEAEVAAEAAPLKGKLPDDFPGHSSLDAAGLTTYAKVRKQLDSLEEIEGIGPATAEKIREAMGESSAAEEEAE